MSSDNGKELAGKVAIVTGAGRLRGIGRASAVRLAEMGAHVVVTGTGRDPSSFPDDEKAMGWRDIESVAGQVREQGVRALPLVVDVSNSEAVEKMVADTISEFGRVDILINNAAFRRGEDRVAVVDLDESLFRRVLDIKVVGSFLCAKAVARHLLAQDEGGAIVNLSSTAGKRGSANTSAYNAANFAINGFTQALAKELAPHLINVNGVCPGAIETARMDILGRGETWEALEAAIPMKRAGTDEEVADLIGFLCSDRARYITGQMININGGSVTEL
ncbi:MAG: SDR family NAD(P)-dependent oxidoreductase [Chloroflexi bacterium]|nr:SDR family NAD(P)-dependent oxidoreductase [Chloroflexota bacterium]